ncbi:MAG TPA: tetratricopeptide repeat protein, partial [Pirellulaceae bacterium]|nr:tetratricopeptide repeat protein [Pirellulaceae bacterium]
MSTEHNQARAIFLEAIEQSDAAARAEFIARACRGDAELRARVERLLRSHEQLGSFHEQPPVPEATIDQPAEHSGTQIGPYKLIERIGEGGMGVVWLAQQSEPVRRVVAVKLIKAGMDSRQVIARFEAERQALALMDHPHIAKVLDGGSTSAGRPYFVMDLVRGVPITRYCDEHHLTPRQRLELFVPVCQAIQHAHQKGIIHRDLKPSNVLVALYDGRPVPKVIDFGVAKAAGQPLTEQTLVTGFGAIVGTLEYMSPEQAEINQLDIDTRSDIYSLGVLLYELLTGSPPFSRQELEQAGMLEMLRVIREEEPSKPSTKLSTAEGLPTLAANRGTEPARLTKLVRGELDWIVMKALEKDRNRRYETAAGFAADLERYLADEPVQACPPSAMYRLSKFVRRNKGAIAFTFAATLLLLVALGGIVGGIGWALRDRAAVRQQMAMQEEQRALKFRTEISAALDEAETSFQQERLPQAMEAVRRAEGLLASAGGDEALGRRAGVWRANLAMVVRLEEIRLARAAEDKEYIDWVGADEAYRQAFKDYGLDVEGLLPVEAVKRLRASPISGRLVAALEDWFVTKRHAGVAGWEEMLSLVQQVDTDAWRNRFREVFRTEQWPTLAALARDEKLLAQPPATVYLLSLMLAYSGQHSQAVEILLAAQKRHAGDFWINFHLGDSLVSSNPTPIQASEGAGYLRVAVAQRPESPMVHVSLGYALWKANRPADAETAFRRALALKPDFARAHLNLGVVLREQGKSEEGIAEYREAIRVVPNYGKAHLNLAFAVEKNGELDEAEGEFREAVRCLPRDPPTNLALANFLNKRNKLVEAQEVLRSYLRNMPDDLNAAQVHANTSYNLGHVLRQQKRMPEGIAAFQEARASFHNLLRLKPDDSVARNRLTAINSHLAMELKQLGRWPEAIDVLEELVRGNSPSAASELFKILTNCPAPEHRNSQRALEVARKMVEWAPTAYNLQLLGWAEYREGNWQASIDALEKSRKLQRNPTLGDPYQWLFLSMAHWKLGNRVEARKWYDRSVWWLEYYNLNTAEALAFHAEAAKVLGITPPAEDFWEALRKAQESFQASQWTHAEEEYRRVVASYPNSAVAHQRLGEVLEKQNRLREAEDAIRQAIQLAPEEIVYLSYLASMLNRQRRGEESESLMREAVRFQPDNPWTHHWLGDSLLTQRRYTE